MTWGEALSSVPENIFPEEARALAKAVLADDVGAVNGLLDFLLEWRANHANFETFPSFASLWKGAPVRMRKRLTRGNIKSLAHVLSLNEDQWLREKNFGPSTLNWLRKWLAAHGLHIAGEGNGQPPTPA